MAAWYGNQSGERMVTYARVITYARHRFHSSKIRSIGSAMCATASSGLPAVIDIRGSVFLPALHF